MPLLRKRIRFWLVGTLGGAVLRLLHATWRVEFVDPDGISERVRKREARMIVAFWHRQMLTLLCGFRHYPFCVAVSEHRDGEYVAQVVKRYGYLPVRGSTTRGSRKLLRGLLAAMNEGWSCAITPEGPRGPKFSVQPGFIMLARRSGVPVYPVGLAVEHAWVLRSWDAFVVPKPYSRIAVVLGDPISADLLAERSTGQLCAALKEAIERATEKANGLLEGRGRIRSGDGQVTP
jgi:hypothetical protein